MAGKSNTSATFFAQKKLLGKAHTSNLKVDGEEVIGSNIQAASSLVFGETIPTTPAQTLYLTSSATGSNPTVEYIPFVLTALTGTTYDANVAGGGEGSDSGESSQSSGPHAYKFVFPSDYESNSENPKAGVGPFRNNEFVHHSLGSVQLVPPFFSQDTPNPYIIKIYKDNGSGGIGDQIPLLDNIDWNVDYYNGILFLQDYVASKIPAFAKAFAYIGEYSDKGIFNQGLTGSLTKLPNGKSYLEAGNNITITTGSSGQVTIAATAAAGSTRSKLSQKVTSNQIFNTSFKVSGSNMSTGRHDPSYIDVFYNGNLLLSGSSSQITSNPPDADYTIVANSNTDLKFSFDLSKDDLITLVVFEKP